MSRMENDPSLYTRGLAASRFPSTRRSHFPAYSAMIQFECAFYARHCDGDRASSRCGWLPRGEANPSEREGKRGLKGGWAARGDGEG